MASLLTYSMVQGPSRAAKWFAASQEFPRISRNPNVHYRTHKRPPPVSILGQPNPVHIPTSHLLEIHPNIIHPSTPRSPQWSPSLRSPHQDPIHPHLLTHTRHMPNLTTIYYICVNYSFCLALWIVKFVFATLHFTWSKLWTFYIILAEWSTTWQTQINTTTGLKQKTLTCVINSKVWAVPNTWGFWHFLRLLRRMLWQSMKRSETRLLHPVPNFSLHSLSPADNKRTRIFITAV